MADDANVAAKALLENPQFMEMFQRALESEGGDGGNLKEMPKEGDPKRDAWLKDLQAKLQKESMKEATKTLEEVHSDSQGQWMYVLPTPGFCIKCLVSGGAKVFINVCQHERIAEPVPMESESGAEEEVRFRIPLSCGQARPGEDKGGKPCKVYDVIVNPNTIKRCGDDHEFRRFVAALCMQWIKQKMEPTLNADEFRNLNFKAKGTLEPQRIRLSQLSKNTNAMGDEIKLPQTSAAATAPTQVGGTSGTGKLIEELGGEATTAEAASSPVSAGVDERVLLASDVATKGGSSATQEPPTQNAPAVIKLSKEGNYDWSTHKKPSMNVFFRESVPAFYDVELFIPNIQTIKEVDVRVSSKKLECFYVDDEADCSAPFLAVVFDYPVSEEIQSAKFVRKTSRLRMQLHVELPDETSAPRTTPSRDAVEEEEEEERLAREKRQAEWAEQRTKEARQQAEEQQVMDERKAYVENLSAVQSGEVPPVIREEIDAMPVAQLPLMLRRIEGRIRKGDSIDTMLDKLPEEVLDGLGDYLREKLSLAPRKRNTTKASKKVSFSADVADKKAPAAASPTAAPAAASTPTPPATAAEKNDGVSIEYNYAKKSQQLFGVEFRNRYLFALDN